MTEVVEISDDDPPHRAENESPLSANHAFNELKSLKTEFESKGSLLDKTCSELSNIMTRYHAQIILKHEQLDKSLIGADLSRLSQLENELREYRTENARLQKQVTDMESKIRDRDEELVQVGNGILKMKEDGIAKDKLIQKLQAQMRQEAMDHQAEITALKDVLEHSEKYGGAINSGPVTLSITGLEPKRRKVTRASVDQPQIVSKSSPQKPSPSRPSTNISSNAAIPSTSSSLKIKSSPSILPLSSGPSTRSADQSEVLDSSSETDQSFNEPLDDDRSGQPFFKLDEVNDDSNSGIEVIMPDPDVDSSAVAETKQTDRHEEELEYEIIPRGIYGGSVYIAGEKVWVISKRRENKLYLRCQNTQCAATAQLLGERIYVTRVHSAHDARDEIGRRKLTHKMLVHALNNPNKRPRAVFNDMSLLDSRSAAGLSFHNVESMITKRRLKCLGKKHSKLSNTL